MKKVIVVTAVLCVLLVACKAEPVGSTTLTPSKSNKTVQVQLKACQVLQGQLTQLQHRYQLALSSKRLLLLNSDGQGNTQAMDQKIHKLQGQTSQAQAQLTSCLNSSSSTSS
jgi:hypothetical protein